MKLLNVKSEIGKLKKVLVHRPGKELDNLTPKMLEQLLFDDIPWLDMAVSEHNHFAALLQNKGVEVLYLSELVAQTLDTSREIRDLFIKQFITEANVTSETLASVLTDYLNSFTSTLAMVTFLVRPAVRQV
ncbi:MAG TPA: arginine deiminase family protein, partial [Bacilli bacterium]|nr:arginine deiminase family protein [Bacilli bacterium]